MKNLHPPIAQTLVNLDLLKSEQIVDICEDMPSANHFMRSIYKLSKEFSSRFGAPLFNIEAIDPSIFPSDVMELKLVEKHTLLPFYRHCKELYIAMVDPTN